MSACSGIILPRGCGFDGVVEPRMPYINTIGDVRSFSRLHLFDELFVGLPRVFIQGKPGDDDGSGGNDPRDKDGNIDTWSQVLVPRFSPE